VATRLEDIGGHRDCMLGTWGPESWSHPAQVLCDLGLGAARLWAFFVTLF
jgi:hypothetical protein